jgi:enoyl-CoA hydratase/carnithine racemase
VSERDDVVLFELAGGVATLTLNRPEALNAWTPEMEARWNALLDRCVADPDVRAIVVTGAGRGFCAGGDAGALARRSTGDEARPVRERPLTALSAVPKPTIAAINGGCVGLGLALALCCDIRFAADGVKIAAAFPRRGLLAEFHTAALLPAVVGRAHANDLLLSGRTVRADEALGMGLVNRVVPAEQLLHEAFDYAADIAANCSPAAIAGIKAQLRGTGPEGPESTPRLHDVVEGMASLRERRAPDFPGLDPSATDWPFLPG